MYFYLIKIAFLHSTRKIINNENKAILRKTMFGDFMRLKLTIIRSVGFFRITCCFFVVKC